jgi:hypothetical protein
VTAEIVTVLALDTTGLPGRNDGWHPQVIGIGAAAVMLDGPGTLLGHDGILIRHPEDHLRAWPAAEAFKHNQLTPERVLRDGIDPAEARRRLEGMHGPLAGFNWPFVRDMLLTMNARVDGTCLMSSYGWAMGRKARRDGTYTVARRVAARWAEDKGHDLYVETDIMPTERKAIRDAKMVIALRTEIMNNRALQEPGHE